MTVEETNLAANTSPPCRLKVSKAGTLYLLDEYDIPLRNGGASKRKEQESGQRERMIHFCPRICCSVYEFCLG